MPLIGTKRALLGTTGIGWLLNDSFNDTRAAGSVNGTPATPGPGTRVVVDTASDLSLSGGNMVLGGYNANGDPGLWLGSVTRAAGVLAVAHFDLGHRDNGFVFSFDTNQSGSGAELVKNVTSTLRDPDNTVISGTLVAWRNYYLALVLKSTGAYIFAKERTQFPNWTMLWHGTKDNTATLYPQLAAESAYTSGTNLYSFLRVPQELWLPTAIYDSFTRSNGAIGTSESTGPDGQAAPAKTWTGTGAAVASNKAVITPTQGSNLITNNELTTDLTGWTDPLGVDKARVDSSADPGTGSTTATPPAANDSVLKITRNTGEGTNAGAFSNILSGVSAGDWIFCDVLVWSPSANTTVNAASIRLHVGGSGSGFSTASEDAWEKILFTLRAGASERVRCLVAGGVNADDAYFDRINAKKLTLSTLFSSLVAGSQDVVADVDLVVTARTQAGLVLCLDSAASPANFLIAYHDGTKAHLEKCVAGTYTELIAATATYSANATLRVIKDGNSWDLFYNGAKVGTTQTVSDAGIKDNTIHGLFSTYASNTMDNFTIFPRKTGYSILNKWIR